MPSPQPQTKLEKPVQDPGHNPLLKNPPRIRNTAMPISGPKTLPTQRRASLTLPGDTSASPMTPQHYKDLIAKLTSGAPKPYGAIPPPKQRQTRRKTMGPSPSDPTDALPLNPELDDMAELAEEDMFGAYPTPPSTPPSSRGLQAAFGSSSSSSKPNPRLTKRQSLPATLSKVSPTTSESSSKSAYVTFPPPTRTSSSPSWSPPTSLLRLSSSSSPPKTSNATNRFSLYKFSISPPGSTYATLRSLNPFSTPLPAPPPSPGEKSPLSQPVLTSPTESIGRFFTFLDDVAPVVAAAGGELVGISEMPKWAEMEGTTSATVSTLSALLRNNDRLRVEMQFGNPAVQPPSLSSGAPSIPMKRPTAPLTAAAAAPPAPLVIPGTQHVHIREPRLNPAYLRMMAAEMNMMRAGKLVGPLRPRGWLPRRRDPWEMADVGRRSELRNEVVVVG